MKVEDVIREAIDIYDCDFALTPENHALMSTAIAQALRDAGICLCRCIECAHCELHK